ncbi:hypothetical protein G6F56_005011 [Rhizopus delemar]|nr:hypothetical protein G6F56_005011 [Rhizopus delemar]
MTISKAYHNTEEGSFGVLNFRDLGISTADNADDKKYLKEGLVFRSATLDNMNEKNVNEFIKAHKIRTILDLRTEMEGQKGLPIDKTFPTVVLDSLDPNEMKNNDSMGEIIEADTSVKQTTLRKKYRVDIAGKNFQRSCIFASCSFPLKVYIVLLMLFCQRQKAGYVVGKQVLSRMGVSQMVKEFTVHCQPEIKEALMIFTEQDNYPIEIHCTQGKDRTGMISALVLSIAGVPEEIIVSDYAKTQKGLSSIYQQMLEDVRRVGLSDDFVQAPPQV